MTDSNETKKGKEPLIIQQKVYDMIMYAYPAIEQFPKSQKFSLAQDMKKCLDAIMRYVIAANKKYTKKTTLQELDIENEALKIYIRMAFELGYLPPKKYEIWSGMAVEVGKMIGGWIKAADGFRGKLKSGTMKPSFAAGAGPLSQRLSKSIQRKTWG